MALSLRFDPADPALQEDPYPIYRALRAAGRTVRAGPGQIAATRYADVSALLRSSRLSNQFPEEYRHFAVGPGAASDFLNRILLHRDPPIHDGMRRMLSVPLVRARLPALAARIRSLAQSLMDEALQRTSFDAVKAFALPLPIMVICEILGVPTADAAVVRHHAAALSLAFKLKTTDEERSRIDSSLLFLRDYVKRLIVAPAAAESPTTLVDAARTAHRGGADLPDIVDNLVFLFFAGFETTASLITTASNLLALHPAVFDELRSNPTLIDSFIDEVLRFDAPIQSRARMVVEPLVIGERTLRSGRVILLLIGSANRDPNVFVNPDQFALARRSHQHLSFGAGPHFCLGAALARIEAQALFTCLIRGCRSLQPSAPAVRDMSSVFRTYESVAVMHARA